MIDYNGKNLFADEATSFDWVITATKTGATTITITNDDLVDDGIELDEAICSESELRFGACEASELRFRIASDATGVNLVGYTLTVTVTPSGADEALQVGVYKVSEDKLSDDGDSREITAYDALYEMHTTDVSAWYGSLFTDSSSKVTLGTIRRGIEDEFGIRRDDPENLVYQVVNETKKYKRDIVLLNVQIDKRNGNIDINTGEIISGGVGVYTPIDGTIVPQGSKDYRITFAQDINHARVFFYTEESSQTPAVRTFIGYTDVYANDPYFRKPSNCALMYVWVNATTFGNTAIDIISYSYLFVLPAGSMVTAYTGNTYLISADGDDVTPQYAVPEAHLYYYRAASVCAEISRPNASHTGNVLNQEYLPHIVSGYGDEGYIYISTNDNEPNADMSNMAGALVLEIVGLDNIKNVQLIYANNLETRTELFEYIPEMIYPYGVTPIGGESNINDNELVSKGFDGAVSAGTLLKAYCELNGVFGHIGRDGKIKYIQLKSADGLHPHIGLHPHTGLHPSSGQNPKEQLGYEYENGSLQYANYKTLPITKLQIRATGNDVGAIAGASGNDYVIENNPLTYSMGAEQLQRVADNLLPILSQASYTPYSVTAMGNPCIEVGDAVTMFHDGGSVEGYVLHRVLSGIQSLTDEYSAEGSEVYEDAVNGINYELQRIQGKFMEIDKTIEGLSMVVGDVDQNLIHKIQITAEGLDEEISRATGAETAIRTSVNGLSIQINGEDGISHGLEVTQQALSSEITRATSAEGTLSSSISQTASSLSSEISRATTAEGNLSSSIQQTASSLSSEITRAQGAESTLSSSIQQTASALTSEVSRAQSAESSLSSSISQTASEVSSKVSQTGGSSSSFAWSLLSNAFKLKANGEDVFVANANGVDVYGAIKSHDGDNVCKMTSNGLTIGTDDIFARFGILTDRDTHKKHLNLSAVISLPNLPDPLYVEAPVIQVEYDEVNRVPIATITVSKVDANEIVCGNDSPVLTADNWSQYIPNGNGVSY